MNNNFIAFRIKKVREFRNYSQKYMAHRLSITQSSYCSLETGKTIVKGERLAQIAEILEVPVLFLTNENTPLFNIDLHMSEPTGSNVHPVISVLKDEIIYLRKQNEELIGILGWQNLHI